MTAKEFITLPENANKNIVEICEAYALLKCKEAARNTRHKSIEINLKHFSPDGVDKTQIVFANQEIMHMPFNEVSPFKEEK